jgi:hypothetical protein
VQIQGGSREQLVTFFTALFHSLQVFSLLVFFFCRFDASLTTAQYPYEQDEDGQYYSGYDDKVHECVSYIGYSIWVIICYSWVALFDAYDAYTGYLSCSLGLADPLHQEKYMSLNFTLLYLKQLNSRLSNIKC